jgi:hypothetical protein
MILSPGALCLDTFVFRPHAIDGSHSLTPFPGNLLTSGQANRRRQRRFTVPTGHLKPIKRNDRPAPGDVPQIHALRTINSHRPYFWLEIWL